jgi:hypothetical protein
MLADATLSTFFDAGSPWTDVVFWSHCPQRMPYIRLKYPFDYVFGWVSANAAPIMRKAFSWLNIRLKYYSFVKMLHYLSHFYSAVGQNLFVDFLMPPLK